MELSDTTGDAVPTTLGQRIRRVIFLMFAMFVVALAVALFGFGAVERENSKLAEESLPILVQTRTLVSNVARLTNLTFEDVSDQSDVDTFLDRLTRERRDIEATVRSVEGFGASVDVVTAIRRTTDQIAKNLTEMVDVMPVRAALIAKRVAALHRVRDARASVDEIVEDQTLAASDAVTAYRKWLEHAASVDPTVAELKKSVINVLDRDLVRLERLMEMQFELRRLDDIIETLVETVQPDSILQKRARYRLTLRQLARVGLDVATPSTRASLAHALEVLSGPREAEADVFGLQTHINDLNHAVQALRIDNQELMIELDMHAANLFTMAGEQTNIARTQTAATVDQFRVALLVIGLLAFGAMLIFGWIYVVRNIGAPLDALNAATYRLAAGDLDVEIATRGDRDLVRLARTMEVFRHNARLVKRQAAELQARSNEDLQQFANVSAHDMREPLRTIRMYLGLLRERLRSSLTETDGRHFGYVIDAAQRMDALVSGQLSFSRLQRTAATRNRVDLDRELRAVCQDLDAIIDERGAVVSWSGLPVITGDSGQLRQLFQNLISNALKFNKAPTPTVTIDGAREGDRWRLRVTDNGFGVSSRDVPKLFNLFFRGHSAEKFAGTGLGLAIARRVVENHGGEIWLDPEYEDGARFVFTISV
ncbi:MAG: ATP-binding protein [Pseudomonadota bacterium]